MHVTTTPVTSFKQNCAVLRCDVTAEGVAIDPGGDLESVMALVESQGIKLVKILLTHGHLDHAADAGKLARQLDLKIIGPHADDEFWLEGLPMQAQMFGSNQEAEVVKSDLYLEQGDKVCFGEVVLEVLHCPGHTPGHVAFFDPESRVAIVGDLLFKGSIGRSDFPRGDYDTLIRSLQEQILPLGDDVTFYCGHGPSSTIGEERRTNPFLLHPERYRG